MGDFSKSKRIVITGESGQLGSELKDLWTSSENYNLIFLDREKFPLDKPENIKPLLADLQPDYIVHAAAYTSVDLAEDEEHLADLINHQATAEIAKYAGANNIKLIFVSTDYVFQGTEDFPLIEDFPTNPINVYGLTKLNAEKAVLDFVEDSIIIRTSWVYSIYGRNFVKTMINLMSSKEEISVVNDQFGSPTYAWDLALLIKTIITEKDWISGIYHYSNEGKTSWFDFAVEIKELSHLDCKINPVSSSMFITKAKRPKFSLLSKEKIKDTFNIQIPNWKDSLKIMIDRLNRSI